MANEGTDWMSSGRSASMIARNFSADLNDAFSMDRNLDGLVQSVQLKKEAVNSQTQELQALEARLRDTEQRLREQQSRDPSPAGKNDGTNSSDRRQPLGNTFSGQENNGRPESSTTGPRATQAPPSQSMWASTMSHWRPIQNTTSGTGGGHAGSAPSARPSGQENSRYAK
ncbi:MAG: hypothetical protein ALECFALPRED_006550 [Alectoria fallacina]|uniref:Uncharacterized protein n=1 Tax=Alectoria fallacina TaxID=1903189 RepID=A0A8H3GA43_9LECA|nr:MAG: hypothetical protein ALECFALPRED_006550 [Alectoria fallacina]